VADAEVLSIPAGVFEALNLEVTIRINNRLILDGIFTAVGVPKGKAWPISSAVDKINKLQWAEVKQEMVKKELKPDVAGRQGTYVVGEETERTFSETLDFRRSDDFLSSNEDVRKGIA
jgi:histidyl-tRNA synthetase